MAEKKKLQNFRGNLISPSPSRNHRHENSVAVTEFPKNPMVEEISDTTQLLARKLLV